MSRQLPESIPLGFVHTDAYDGRCGKERATFREKLIVFLYDELRRGRLDADVEVWTIDWTRRVDPRESGPFRRLALDWFGGKSRENGSHPDFPGIRYTCDVTAYPRPIQEEQEGWDRDPYEAEWANMCAGSSAYPDIPLYRPELVKGRLLSASDQSSCSERSRGPAPPWAVAIRQTVLDRAWRAIRNEPACPDEQSSDAAERPLTAPQVEEVDSKPISQNDRASESSTPKRRRGRSRGDGVKNDDAAVRYMFDLFKDGKATSKQQAANAAIRDLELKEFAKNAWRRLSDKFTCLYRPQRHPDETWHQTCRRIADEMQTK